MNLFVIVQVFYLFSCRSLTIRSGAPVCSPTSGCSSVSPRRHSDRQRLTYLPVMNTLFQTAPIGWQAWLRILLVATAAAVVVAIDKRRLRGRML